MQVVSRPKTPVTFEFKNIPGNNFRKKIKFTKYFSYFLWVFFTVVGIVVMSTAPISLEIIGATLLCFLIPLLLVCFVKHYSDDYVFEEVSPGQYRSVLKAEGFGKLDNYQKKELLKQIFENGDETQTQVQIPKKHNSHLYAAIISLVLIVCLMFWAPITRKMICNHTNTIGGKHIYKCELYPKTVLRNLDVINLGVITNAFVASKYNRKDGTSYQIQFRTPNNINISYTDWWLKGLSFMLDRKVNALNKRFSKGENFTYYLVNYIVVLGFIILFFLPFIIAILEQKKENEVFNNNFFSPERYRAILKAEGLEDVDNINIKPLIINDDKDVDDLTKQFYDDGK